jgi:hypothetical protein
MNHPSLFNLLQEREMLQHRIEKEKNKLYNVCLNQLKSDFSRNDYRLPRLLHSPRTETIAQAKLNKGDLLQQLELKSLHHRDMDQFKAEVSQQMAEVSQQMFADAIQMARERLPTHNGYLARLEAILSTYESLQANIEQNGGQLRKQYEGKKKFQFWGGAGVIVSAGKRYRQKHTFDLSGGQRMIMLSSSGDADVVVGTDRPHPIVWLMYTLRDLTSEYLDYMNKYEFYGRVAETAQTQLYEDPSIEDKDLLLACLETAREIVTTRKELVLESLREFDEFCRNFENDCAGIP